MHLRHPAPRPKSNTVQRFGGKQTNHKRVNYHPLFFALTERDSHVPQEMRRNRCIGCRKPTLSRMTKHRPRRSGRLSPRRTAPLLWYPQSGMKRYPCEYALKNPCWCKRQQGKLWENLRVGQAVYFRSSASFFFNSMIAAGSFSSTTPRAPRPSLSMR
jgi:hypothetical protein